MQDLASFTDLEDRLWAEARTVVVLGPVSRAVWMQPQGHLPGVLAAGNQEQAMEAARRILGALCQEIGSPISQGQPVAP